MRTIEIPSSFKRDFKRESKGPHWTTLVADLKSVLDTLVHDQPVTASLRDHHLIGDTPF